MSERELTFSRDAAKVLRRMPRNVADTIRSKLSQYVEASGSMANNVKALKGPAGWLRLRVGDWRVIFSDDGGVVAVIRIAPIGSAYD